MNPILAVIIAIVLANMMQFYLYRMQMNKINNLFYEMREKGDVLVGKHRGLKGGGMILLQLKDTVVQEAYYVQGVSVFVKPKPVDGVAGKDVKNLNFSHKVLQKAYENALENYS